MLVLDSLQNAKVILATTDQKLAIRVVSINSVVIASTEEEEEEYEAPLAQLGGKKSEGLGAQYSRDSQRKSGLLCLNLPWVRLPRPLTNTLWRIGRIFYHGE